MTADDDDPHDEALEETLRRAGPPRLASAQRAQVLAAISAELRGERSVVRWRPRLHVPGWAVAAAVVLGVVLNVWAMQAENTRDLRLLGVQPPSRRVSEIADAVRSVTDHETAALFEQRLQAICREQERKARGSNVWPMLSTQVNSPG